jgi:type III secretory pathway component EscS
MLTQPTSVSLKDKKLVHSQLLAVIAFFFLAYARMPKALVNYGSKELVAISNSDYSVSVLIG